MSTICKLDPLVRQQRTARRTARRFFGSYGRINTDIGIMCIAIYDILGKLKLDSSQTGAAKHVIAERVEKEFEVNMAAFEAKQKGKFTQASTPVTGITGHVD